MNDKQEPFLFPSVLPFVCLPEIDLIGPARRLVGQVSAVQNKWYARRFNIPPFNKAFDAPGRVFFFFTVNYSGNFQVGIRVGAVAAVLASTAGRSHKRFCACAWCAVSRVCG